MLAGAGLVLTIVAALGVGIGIGYIVLRTLFNAVGKNTQS